MDFLAPRGVNRLSCASGAAFKDNWQLSQAQLGEFIFVLNRQAGLPLKMNIERLGRGEQRGRGRIASGGRLGLRSWQHLSGGKPLHGSSWVAPQENQPSSSWPGVPQGWSLCYLGLPIGLEAAATSHSRPTAMQTVMPINKDARLPPCSRPSLSTHFFPVLEL